MFRKKFDEIELEDLKDKIDNNVMEGKRLEYKSQLPATKNSKLNFLKDISAFANSSGGDLIIGIEEGENSQLKDDLGVKVENTDEKVSSLSNLIKDSITPSISPKIRPIEVSQKKIAIVIRIEPSIIAPHRIEFRGEKIFPRRHANGSYPMDVDELRRSFLESSTIKDKIEQFKRKRIFKIKSNNIPVPSNDGESFIVLHIIPMTSYKEERVLDEDTLGALNRGEFDNFSPITTRGNNITTQRINLRGVRTFTEDRDNGMIKSYSQLYDDGKIEAVDYDLLGWNEQELSMGAIENKLKENILKYLELLRELDFIGSFYIYIAVIGIENYKIAERVNSRPIQVEEIMLPEIAFHPEEEINEDLIRERLSSVFGKIYHASGISRNRTNDG